MLEPRGGGHLPGRATVFCVNQLGGVGMRNKNSQFAPNADGVKECPAGQWDQFSPGSGLSGGRGSRRKLGWKPSNALY